MADNPNSDSEQTAGVPPAGAQPAQGAAPGVTQSAVGSDNLQLGLQNITGSTINVNLLAQMGPREWVPPTPPRLSREMIGRRVEFKRVSRLLAPGAKTAITAAVHGTPGVGKTLLAEHLAVRLADRYPGGVLLERCGANFRAPGLAQPILDRWGSHAFGRRPLPQGTHFTPDAVCDLLAGHGALLVILDDVWDLDAVQPLLASLPNETCLLITTRSQRLARDLHGQVLALDVLTKPDALALLKDCIHSAVKSDHPRLAGLAEVLGRHALALNLAGRSLDRLPREQWAEAVQEMSRQVRQGQGFGELHLPGDEERESRVEAALKYSYDDLDEGSRPLYRSLGVFAADADFSSQAAASLWACSREQAQRQLSAFVECGLLDCLVEGEHWQQHSLLRAYSLALLRREGDEDEACAHHAHAYLDLMREADDRQVYYRMLPDYPQLRHAFAWAIEHDPELAQSLAANTANLQAAFGFAGDNLAWSQELIQQVRAGGEAQSLAAALVTLGNALWRVAGQGGEDRAGRLQAALEAYDEALRIYTPEAAPLDYAMTQNNRGIVLRDLAGQGGEDRAGRLQETLEAYDEALRFRTPETAPLGHANTQYNVSLLLVDIASLPGEDHRACLLRALQVAHIALEWYMRCQHETYARQAGKRLRRLKEEAGDLFVELWAEAGLGELPEWLRIDD
jgi:tetratricopeptide (TPR) repeat protein